MFYSEEIVSSMFMPDNLILSFRFHIVKTKKTFIEAYRVTYI